MKNRHRVIRRGALTVEFALVLPILFSLLMAAIEFSRVNTIRNTAEIAAYEGARRGILPGATVADVEAACTAALSPLSIKAADVQVSPSPLTLDAPSVTVDIRVPLDSNSYTVPVFFAGRSVNATCTFHREHQETSLTN